MNFEHPFSNLELPSRIHRMVVLTGAGISAESGLKTFRDNNGLWEDHPVEDVATPEAFERDPKLVQRFYNLRRQQLLSDEVHPNSAHKALAELEKQTPIQFTLVTQNVDDLHERAGSSNLIHMHGELLKSRCQTSQQIYSQTEDIQVDQTCPCCAKQGSLRPHIVWFGELPLDMETIYQQLSECDLFVSIGTSGHVYPAAGFVEVANQCGAFTLELNLEPSRQESAFQHGIYGPAGSLVPAFCQHLTSHLHLNS